MNKKTKVEVGQVWKDTYDYGETSAYAKNPPTLTITEVGEGYAKGIRQPSGKRTKVSILPNGRIRGYVLSEES